MHIILHDKGAKSSQEVNQYPDICPYCHFATAPTHYAACVDKQGKYQALFQCNNSNCKKGFVGEYSYDMRKSIFIHSVGGHVRKYDFSPQIEKMSPDFCTIFNEASTAEQHKLHEICGVGYRKSLEFLIKDFCIFVRPDKEQQIKSSMLAQVIGDYVTNENIKKVAQRAAWIGNDETHYVKKWIDKDVRDLKVLISLTVKWIEMEILTAEYEEEMPKI